MTSITTSAIDTPLRRSVERTCDDLAMLVLAAVAVIAGLTFRDYGLGWDDYTHAEYADLLLRMFGSGFKDTAALSFANLYMYGGGFDMVAALLHKVIPLELFETRRLLGAIVGVIGLAVTWRLGRRIGGPLAGLAALLLLALCPIFYGHMFMNPKDAPFAVAMIILMLGLVRLAEEYPQPSPRTILIVGLGAGLSLGTPHPRRPCAGLCHDRLHAAVPGGAAHRGRCANRSAASPMSSTCCCPASCSATS